MKRRWFWKEQQISSSISNDYVLIVLTSDNRVKPYWWFCVNSKFLSFQEKFFQLIHVCYFMCDYNVYCVSAPYAHSLATLPLHDFRTKHDTTDTHTHPTDIHGNTNITSPEPATEELQLLMCVCACAPQNMISRSSHTNPDAIRPAANHQGNSCHPQQFPWQPHP